jgi:hypothetical protein
VSDEDDASDDQYDAWIASTVRQRHRGRVVIGAILLAGGIALALAALVIDARDQGPADDDSVTRAPFGRTLEFTATGAEYTLVGGRAEGDDGEIGTVTCRGTANFEASTGWDSGGDKTPKSFTPPAPKPGDFMRA